MQAFFVQCTVRPSWRHAARDSAIWVARVLSGRKRSSARSLGVKLSWQGRVPVTRTLETGLGALAELSRECAVDAVVEGLRLTEARRAGSAKN